MERRDRSRLTLVRLFLAAAATAAAALTPLAALAQALVFRDGYEGCSLSAWSSVSGMPFAAEPDDIPQPAARFAGRCAMRTAQAGEFVTDTSPGAEPAFIVRFYVYPGIVNGSATVLRARSGATPQFQVRVTADAANATIELLGRGGAPVPVASGPTNAWYGIQVDWDAFASRLDVQVRGAGFVNAAASHPNPPQSGDAIDEVDVGWIVGTATLSPAAPDPRSGVLVDEYDSRRSTPPGFLLPGDADGNDRYGSSDLATINNEVGGAVLASGAPDCDENGLVEAADANCVSAKALRFTSGME